MKVSLTNNDVKAALQAYLATQMPALADADIALEYSLSRGPHAQLTVNLHIGADAEAFRATEDAKPVPAKPFGRKGAPTAGVVQEEETEEVEQEEEADEQELAPAPAARRFASRKTAE